MAWFSAINIDVTIWPGQISDYTTDAAVSGLFSRAEYVECHQFQTVHGSEHPILEEDENWTAVTRTQLSKVYTSVSDAIKTNTSIKLHEVL